MVQGRFQSTIIEKESYLMQAIIYLLQNPVRAGIIQKAEDYLKSSAGAYQFRTDNEIVDIEWVIDLFGGKGSFLRSIANDPMGELPIRMTSNGDVLGSDNFLKSALKKSDRRNRPSDQSKGYQRKGDRYFEPVEKIIQEFEKMHGIKLEEIDPVRFKGKRQRGEFLVLLKDLAGLTYKEINEFDVFRDLNFESLRSVYRIHRKKA